MFLRMVDRSLLLPRRKFIVSENSRLKNTRNEEPFGALFREILSASLSSIIVMANSYPEDNCNFIFHIFQICGMN